MTPVVGVGGGIVFDAQGRVLLIERGNPPRMGLWNAPGGRLEPRETPAQAGEENALIGEVSALACMLEQFTGRLPLRPARLLRADDRRRSRHSQRHPGCPVRRLRQETLGTHARGREHYGALLAISAIQRTFGIARISVEHKPSEVQITTDDGSTYRVPSTPKAA